MENKKEAQIYLENLLTKGSKIPVAHNSYDLELPPWYDDVLFKRAQQYFKANIFAMFSGMLAGLIAVLSIPSILKILIHTNQSSVPLTAYKRYVETIFHTVSWYEHDLKPGTLSWKSLSAVRKRHVGSSKVSDENNVGIISQKDLALTQFGFVGFIIIRANMLGVQLSKENIEALIHFWRVIGYMIGIDDQFNICTDDWKTTYSRLELVMSDVYQPYLEITSTDFHEMASALLNGLWCFNPLLTNEGFIYYTKMMCDCRGYYYYKSDKKCLESDKEPIYLQFSWYSRFLLALQVFLHGILLNYAIFRWYYNHQIYMSRFIIYYFPFLAFYSFGIKKSYVRVFKDETLY